MPKSSFPAPSRAIGRTLKRWREGTGLSMRGVAEASARHPEPITFDYLSRLERGHNMPSIPKLATLAAVYDRPLMDLVDLYELEELRSLLPKKGSFETYRRVGVEALEAGHIPKATACFLGMLEAAAKESPGDPQKLAQACNNIGGALCGAARYSTARRFLEEGLRIVESPRTKARLLDNLAIVHYHLDDLVIAEILSREACELVGPDEALRRMTRATRAALLLGLKRFAEAETLFREAVEESRKSGKEGSEIRQLYNLGCCLVEQGQTEEGLAHLRTAAARAVEKGDPVLRARSLYYYGQSLFNAGKKEDAGSPLRSALRLAMENEMRNEVFLSAYYLWLLAREIGAVEDEEKYFEIAKRYRARVQQRSDETRSFDAAVGRPAASAARKRSSVTA